MTSRRTTTDVPFTARQMFDLVADVEKYPDFLPWCKALRVVDRQVENGEGVLTADMVVAYKVFREKFRSKVMLDERAHTIDAHYTEGPFDTLRTRWRFADYAEGGSNIDFFIEFRFRSMLLHQTALMVFEKAFARMTDAFVDRAFELYGGPENGSAGEAAQE